MRDHRARALRLHRRWPRPRRSFYEARAAAGERVAPRSYALGLAHKHLPEMRRHAGLAEVPLFSPMVGDFARGMLVQIPLTRPLVRAGTTPQALASVLAERYATEPCVHVHEAGAQEVLLDGGFLDPEARNGSNAVDLMVFGHGQQRRGGRAPRQSRQGRRRRRRPEPESHARLRGVHRRRHGPGLGRRRTQPGHRMKDVP
jgi:Acetylglutamate semialdehyde dehydrogenase